MAEPAVAATLAVTDWLSIRESWRAGVAYTVSTRRPSDLYVAAALARLFEGGPGGDRVVVSHDDSTYGRARRCGCVLGV